MRSLVDVKPSLKIPLMYMGLFSLFLILKFVVMNDSPHFVAMWRMCVIGGVAIISISLIARLTTHYQIACTEVIESRGILNRTTIRVPIARISNFQVEQSFIQRVLRMGNVKVDSPGSIAFEIRMLDLDKQSIQRVIGALSKRLEKFSITPST